MAFTTKKSVLFLGLGVVVLFAGFLATFYLTFRDVTRVTIEKQPRVGMARQATDVHEVEGEALAGDRQPELVSGMHLPFQISRFSFHEGGYDGPVKSSPVYERGETFWLKLDIVGFGLKSGNVVLSQDYYLYRADDLSRPIVDRPKAVKKAEPWEKNRVVSFGNHGEAPSPGDYVIETVVHDHTNGLFTSQRIPFKVIGKKNTFQEKRLSGDLPTRRI